MNYSVRIIIYYYNKIGRHCDSIFQLTPKNITRTEGDRNVLIPCITQGNNIVAWQIKYGEETAFKSYTQEQVFKVNELFTPKINIGIVIYEVTAEMNGTAFMCHYTKTGFISTRTDVGILIVRRNHTTNIYDIWRSQSSVVLLEPNYVLFFIIMLVIMYAIITLIKT